MSGRFKVGIVGAGGIAKACHIPGWREIKDVEIKAIADINLASAQEVAKANGITCVFSDYRAMMKLDLDAVDICTPNRTHTPVALAALSAGKHVICEKPLAVTTREVRKMGELADRKRLTLMTAQNQRFAGVSRALKKWIEHGNLGKVYHARVRAMRRSSLPAKPGFIDAKLSGGGPCMDIGVHALDLCMWLMGFPKPVRVSGSTKVNFAKGYAIPGMWGEWDRKLFSVEDFASGFVHFENGATMTIEASWLGHQAENDDMSCQLFGTGAGVKWPSGEFASVEGGSLVQGTVASPGRPDKEKPYWDELKAFHDCVTGGKRSPVPWSESIKVIAILEGIYASQSRSRELRLVL